MKTLARAHWGPWLAAFTALVGLGLALWWAIPVRPGPARTLRAEAKDGLAHLTAAGQGSHLAALVVICLAGAALRAYFLDCPMRGDESCTFDYYIAKPLWLGLTNYYNPNNHLFHTLLAHLSVRAFGIEPWAIRLPVFVAGCLLVPAVYLAGRFLFNKEAGLLAAGLAAASPLLIEYSTNARGYSLLALVFVLAVILAGHFAQTRSRPALAAVCSALGFFSLVTMLLAFSALVLWLAALLIAQGRSLALADLLDLAAFVGATVLLTILLYLPAVAAVDLEYITSHRALQGSGLGAMVRNMAGVGPRLWSHWHPHFFPGLGYVLAAGFIVCLGARPRLGRFRVPLSLVCLAAVVLNLILRPAVFASRHFLVFLPVYLIWAAAGLTWVLGRLLPGQRRSWGPALSGLAVGVCLVLGVLIVRGGPLYATRDLSLGDRNVDAEAIVLFLKNRLRAGDMVENVEGWSYDAFYPVHYYNRLHGVNIFVPDGSHDRPQVRQATRRIWWLTPLDRRDLIGPRLAQLGFQPDRFKAPKRLTRFREHDLFVTERTGG
ncbi:MAG: glycosyltransferase family 39 protein [Deltaproteobacteria bacterium]|nr:glycosyltransferase family 39 protein [Deltaproteobacteria bacterium]